MLKNFRALYFVHHLDSLTRWGTVCAVVAATVVTCASAWGPQVSSSSVTPTAEGQSSLIVEEGDLPPASDVAETLSYPNVILIMADALRADHVSSYGYHRATTPHLDTLVAAEGARFLDATSTAAWTHPSNAAIVSGLAPASLEIRWEEPDTVLPEEIKTLAEYLHDAGYYTSGFVHPVVGSKHGFAQGFDRYIDSYPLQEPDRWDQVPAGLINSFTMDWIEHTWIPDLSGGQPLFLFLYYFDPHTWYDPPPPYDARYDATYTGTLTSDVYQHGKVVVSGQIVPTERDIEHLIALYDGEISYWDAQLGQLLAYLQGVHLLDNALVIVTSDHGEMFGEHGKYTHRNSLYEEVLRVPLLMRYTGVISPAMVVETPVQSMDIMPTVLDLVGLPIPPGLDAISLHALLEGGTMTVGRDLISEQNGITDPSYPGYWLAPRADLRSIRRDGWKLIHQMDDLSADELYQLQPSSLYETDNLVLSEPNLARELRQHLLTWLGQVYTITGRVADPNGAPFADVRVTSSDGVSTTAVATGAYTLTDLAPGAYTLTPTLSGYAFSPPTRTVSLPPEATRQNFIILPGPVSTTLTAGIPSSLLYTDTQGLPTRLDFPPNSVAQSTTLILTPDLAINGLGLTFAQHAFELAAYQEGTLQTDFAFGTPVTVTIHYSAKDVRLVSDENQLIVLWWTYAGWQDASQTCDPPTHYERDIINRVLGVPICRLGRLGLFGPTHNLYLSLVLRDEH
jgi:arylsulfatase A-like enzyme